ncbi:MAG: hypothetical protein IT233_09205 [Bacteroidia bacterium]|nr:hypothetical protein [Bacteroidia bacterium]
MKKLLPILLLLNSFSSFGQTETKISKDSLPLQVQEQFSKKYKGYSILKVIKAIDKIGIVTYKLEARKEKSANGATTVTIYYLTYDMQGKLVSKIKDKEIYYTDSPPKKQPTQHQSGDGHKH